jgi:hypothetical protein
VPRELEVGPGTNHQFAVLVRLRDWLPSWQPYFPSDHYRR